MQVCVCVCMGVYNNMSVQLGVQLGRYGCVGVGAVDPLMNLSFNQESI